MSAFGASQSLRSLVSFNLVAWHGTCPELWPGLGMNQITPGFRGLGPGISQYLIVNKQYEKRSKYANVSKLRYANSIKKPIHSW